jgi:hypothetical protein
MLMKMLEAGGVPVMTDGLREADEDNPKGYYEVERVKDLAQETDRSWLAESRGRAIKVISFLLKSLPPDLNYRVIFVRRDIEEILASQKKMLARRGEIDDTPPERMREHFQDDLWRATYQLTHRRWFEMLEVHYGEILSRPLEGARKISGFLGGHLDVEAMAGVVDPELYRNRAKK